MNNRPNQDPARFRRRRIEAGLSMTELALEAGVTKSHIIQVEMGKANFSAPNLAKLAKALGCTVADLLPNEPASSESAA